MNRLEFYRKNRLKADNLDFDEMYRAFKCEFFGDYVKEQKPKKIKKKQTNIFSCVISWLLAIFLFKSIDKWSWDDKNRTE